MKRLLVSLLLLVSAISAHGEIITMQIPGAPAGLTMTVGTGVNALPLEQIKNNPNAVNITTWDDSYNNVPLGFNFPFYGKVFNNSWAMTNGLVTFIDPSVSGLGGACCQGVNLTTTTDPRYNYTIYGMHTDLYSWNGQNQYYLRGNNEMTYGWYNLSQCCNNQGGNSFEIKINSQGVIDTRIAGAMVQWNMVTSGMAGDLSKGEHYQYYHGQGLNIAPGSPNIFSWNTNGATGAYDPCSSNPLASPSCSGYQQAYETQQCSINPLFAPSCPGYAQAFHDQQCNANQLSYTDCPGYAALYLTQQCNANALYSPSCPGYQTAYFNQQCTISPLYSPSCPGYQQAYLTQQCNANPLYSSQCPGYAAAYQTQQFNRACQANAQSSPRCSGYVTPIAAVVTTTNTASTTSASTSSSTSSSTTSTTDNTSTTDTTSTTTSAVVTPGVSTNQSTQNTTGTTNTSNQNQTTSGGVVTTQSTTAPATAGTISAAGTLSNPTAVAVIGDSVVNNVISNNSQTQTAIVATSAVAQSNAPSPVNSPTSATSTTTSSTSSSSSSNSSNSSSSNSNSSPSTGGSATQNTRAALVATLTRPGGASGMNSGSTGGGSSGSDSNNSAPSQGQVTAAAGAAMKDADSAGSMEQQKQVQNVVIGAMSYVPGFDVYNVALKDVPFYKSRAIYGNQRTVDNRNASRGLFGATDVVHDKMVQQQFQLGN